MGTVHGVHHCHHDESLTMPKKQIAFWRKDAPKDTKSTMLTPKQKAQAKAKAKAAGRPYPNLVDNAAAARKAKEK